VTAKLAGQLQNGIQANGVRARSHPGLVKRIGFLVVALGAVAVHGVLLYIGFTSASVEVDEGLYLEVVRNVGIGAGYTGDGVYDITGLSPFATEVTTGPTLLVPASLIHATGVDVLWSGRLAGAAFYCALVAALWILGTRIGGKWAGPVAALGPVMFDTFTNQQSPIYAPQVTMGEYAAAAMIAWALVVARKRPGLAGVFIGFAILAKVIAVFMVPAVVIAILLARPSRGWRVHVRPLLRAGTATLVPLAVFEFVKLATLGLDAYLKLVHAYWTKVTDARLPTFEVTQKTQSLIGAWFLLVPVALLLAAAAIALVVGVVTWRVPMWKAAGVGWRDVLSDERVATAVTGVVAGVGIVIAWLAITATRPEWMRHPAPGLVIADGCAMAAVIAMVRVLSRADRVGKRVGAAALIVLVVVTTMVPLTHIDAARQPGRFGFLSDQQAVADAIRKSGTSEVQGLWGPMVPLAVLADKRAHSILYQASPNDLLVIELYYRGQLEPQGQAMKAALCGDIILDSQMVLCWPRPDIKQVLAKAIDVSTGKFDYNALKPAG